MYYPTPWIRTISADRKDAIYESIRCGRQIKLAPARESSRHTSLIRSCDAFLKGRRSFDLIQKAKRIHVLLKSTMDFFQHTDVLLDDLDGHFIGIQDAQFTNPVAYEGNENSMDEWLSQSGSSLEASQGTIPTTPSLAYAMVNERVLSNPLQSATLCATFCNRAGILQGLSDNPANRRIMRPDDSIHIEVTFSGDAIIFLSTPAHEEQSQWLGQFNGRGNLKVSFIPPGSLDEIAHCQLHADASGTPLDFLTATRTDLICPQGRLAMWLGPDKPLRLVLNFRTGTPVMSDFQVAIRLLTVDTEAMINCARVSLQNNTLPLDFSSRYPLRKQHRVGRR